MTENPNCLGTNGHCDREIVEPEIISDARYPMPLTQLREPRARRITALRHAARAIVCAWCLHAGFPALAQQAPSPTDQIPAQEDPQLTATPPPKDSDPDSSSTNYFEQGSLTRSGGTLESLGQNLMGDAFNEYSGSLEFTHTDVSLPGNNKLQVSVGRHLATGTRLATLRGGLFGDWDLEIPHLHTVVANSDTWYGNGTVSPNLFRCSQFQMPPAAAYSSPEGPRLAFSWQYWDGYHLYVPGSGDQTMLGRRASPGDAAAPPNFLQPTDGLQYPVVTKQNWQFSCLPAMERGSGEGFLARAPDGTRYQFDHMVSRTHQQYMARGGLMPRTEIWILPTQVTDRFGNWIRYQYSGSDGWRVDSITSSDGRSITYTYTGTSNRIQTVSDGTRTWRYAYDSVGALKTVTLPDSSQWQFSLASLKADPISRGDPDCVVDGGIGDLPARTGTLTHPSGARASFVLKLTEHGRSNVPGKQATCGTARVSRYLANYSLVSKTFSGPGMPAMTWAYAYSRAFGSYSPCNGCVNTKTVTITDPLNHVTRNTYGTQFGVNEGLLLTSEEGITGSAALRSTSYTYQPSDAGPYPALVGYHGGVADSMSRIWTPQSGRIITQQGVTFSQVVTGFDTFARPTGLIRSSSLDHHRTESTVYYDQTSLWVLGQVASQTIAGHQASSTDFDANNALPSAQYEFGQLTGSYHFNADGTLRSSTDGLGHATTFSNYKRGLAQRIAYADGSAVSGVVNNLGLLTSVTNEVGATWTYGYDAMGRLSSETAPVGDASAYNVKNLSFEQIPTAEYGLGANHWRQTITQGNAVTVNYFDARWRKRLTTTHDAADPGGTRRMQLFNYDPHNRTVFASYPTRSIASITATLAGTRTAYDALGRTTRTAADSELGVLQASTQYLGGFRTQVTNPRGYITTTAYQAFDEPGESAVVSIATPEGVSVGINRDVFGKPLTITRAGSDGTRVTRRYAYDAQHRLCKTSEPETGATVQFHDAAGNVAWRASGLSLPGPACDHASVSNLRKISHTYDERNRLKTTRHGDGSPGADHSYTPDGLPYRVTSDGMTWTYRYNKRRLLVSETLQSAGSIDSIGWGIDANGHVAAMAYPDGTTLSYEPNALGEPTRIGPYATGVTHHPNGAVASYALLNGVSHTVSHNVRGLPELRRDAGVAGVVLQDRYAYDAGGNVTAITDEVVGTVSRSMDYDGLDRLVRADGVWGAGSFTYDALDNLRSSSVGGRTLIHHIDASTNRLVNLTGSRNVELAYDANGNVTQRGTQGFSFDIANRLSRATGLADYTYDGHGRRTLVAYANGQVARHLYSRSGQLLSTVHSTQGATNHVYLGDSLIAEINTLTGASYVHSDALGSPVARTNGSGQFLTRTRYEPYGATAAGTNPRGIGFTGHVNDANTGLVYMQQRYYDPVAGRFLSVDPVTTQTTTNEHFNRYVYTENNPYRFVDPDGLAGEVFELPHQPGGPSGGGGIGGGARGPELRARQLDGSPVRNSNDSGRAALGEARSRTGGEAEMGAAQGAKLLFRRGASDTKALLQRDAQAAENALGIHGVSVSANPAAKAGQVARCATCSSIEAAGFKVEQTGKDLNHHTVELPKPITPDVVRTWNELFK